MDTDYSNAVTENTDRHTRVLPISLDNPQAAGDPTTPAPPALKASTSPPSRSSDNRCDMLVINNGLVAFAAIPRQFRDQEFSAPVINMSLAAEGAALVAEMAHRVMDRRAEQRQAIEDIVADALWEQEHGYSQHRRQAEAVLSALIARGLDVMALETE